MKIDIYVTLDVGEQDSTKDAIESAKNQLRSMPFEDVLELFKFATLGTILYTSPTAGRFPNIVRLSFCPD